MIKTALNHAVCDLFLNNLFDGLISTFGNNQSSDIPKVGSYYSRIEHIDGAEVFYNCEIRELEHHIPDDVNSCVFVKISFEYMNDSVDNDPLTQDEFAEIYGDPEDYTEDEDLPEFYDDDADFDDDSNVDMIYNPDDRTISLNCDFYIFHS